VVRVLQRDSNQLKNKTNETSEQEQGNRCDTRTLLKVVEEKDKKDCCGSCIATRQQSIEGQDE
jgi:hypothetical protein